MYVCICFYKQNTTYEMRISDWSADVCSSDLMAVMEDIRNIVVLTGAGISAEGGLSTLRGPDGLWEGHSVEDVCTPEALRRDPELVHRFYDERRAKLHNVRPNAAH